MNKYARKHIFDRLNSAAKGDSASSLNVKEELPKEFNQKDNIEILKSLMEAMRTEVHITDSENWIDSLTDILNGKVLKNLLYGPGTEIGKTIEEQWITDNQDLPELIPYNKKIEEFKSQLFKVDASITSATGAIADVGAVILCPDENEPRTMSLVPPVHIAVLSREKIYNNFSDLISREGWSEGMPTNLLFISGPSKTADIELTLAYGVHGPKELILLIV